MWKRWTRNGGAKLLAFFASLALWFSVTNEIEFERTLSFPIEYVNVPDGITAVQELPTEARARVRAQGKFLGYRLRGGVCRVDLSRNQVGMNNLVIDGGNLVLPGEVAVVQREVLDPRQINVEFDEMVVRDIAIDGVVEGEPDGRYLRVGKTFVSPAVARVSGPRKLVDDIGLVRTEPVDIDGNRSTVRKKVRLVPPGPPTVVVRPGMVEVGINIEPRVERAIEGIGLALAGGLPDSLVAEFRPSAVSIEVSGARSIVEVAAAELVEMSLRADEWPRGTQVLAVKEFRGPEIVFEVRRRYHLAEAPADTTTAARGGDAPGAADSTGAAAPESGEIVVRLPLPREVEILGLSPERIALTVREKAPVLEMAGPAGAGETPEESAP